MEHWNGIGVEVPQLDYCIAINFLAVTVPTSFLIGYNEQSKIEFCGDGAAYNHG